MLVLVLNVEDGNVRQCDETEVTQEEMRMIDDAIGDIFKFDGNRYWRAAVNVEDEVFSLEWKPL